MHPHTPTLIVTRPEQQQAFWATALAAQGIATVALPLITIAPHTHPTAVQARTHMQSALQHYSAIMHVSPNAAQFFWDAPSCHAWHAQPKPPRLWSPGPGTTRMLHALGFPLAAIDHPDPDHATQFDSEALWAVVSPQITAGSRVLIVRGSSAPSPTHTPEQAEGNGRNWLAHTLQTQGAQVEFLSVYERQAPCWTAAETALVQQAASPSHVWLFSSSEAATHLIEQFPGENWHAHRAIATHPRIAHTLQAAGFGSVWASLPTPDAIAHTLKSHA